MSERTTAPAATGKFDPDPEMNASIEAKIEAGLAQGIDLSNLDPNDAEKFVSLMDRIGVTAEEQRYMAEQSVYRMAKVVLGKKIIETLNAGKMIMDRADVIPCLQAYYEALDEGEIEAAA
jgi:hypothetical protein